ALARWVDSVHTLDDSAVGNDATPVSFAIRPGSTAVNVGQDLMRAGLIRSTAAFRLQVELRDVGTKLSVGEYELRRNMSVNEILDVLTAGPNRRGTLVTI